jgi:hypothetical protein
MRDRSRSVYDFGLLLVIVLAVALATVTVYSQNVATPQNQRPGAAQPSPSPSPTPTPINWSTDPTLRRFVFRSIGPASMGGRIDDFAVPEQNPFVIYRLRDQWRLEVDEQRHDVHADLRHLQYPFDRRHCHRAF